MILVCGGLADRVTELVCARLADCGYPYRLLDLGHYPAGFEINWRWRGSGPSGYIAGPDWRFDLDQLSGVYIRYLGPEGRATPPDVSPGMLPAMYSEHDAGLMVLVEALPGAVVNRLGGGPEGGGVLGHIEVDDAPAMVSEHDEDEEHPHARGGDREEIEGNQVPDMVGEERAPGLGRRRMALGDQARDGALGHGEAKLQELAMDSRRAPERVRGGLPGNQRLDLGMDGRATSGRGGQRAWSSTGGSDAAANVGRSQE